MVHSCMSNEDIALFAPSMFCGYALGDLGIDSNTPAINGLLGINEDQISVLTKAVIATTHRLTPGIKQTLQDTGSCILKVVHLDTKKRVVWPDALGQVATVNVTPDGPLQECKDSSAITLMCTNKGCGNLVTHSGRSLYKGTRWCQIKCDHCGICKIASMWLCTCGSTWNQCSTHRRVGFECSTPPKRRVKQTEGNIPAPHRRAAGRNTRVAHVDVSRRIFDALDNERSVVTSVPNSWNKELPTEFFVDAEFVNRIVRAPLLTSLKRKYATLCDPAEAQRSKLSRLLCSAGSSVGLCATAAAPAPAPLVAKRRRPCRSTLELRRKALKPSDRGPLSLVGSSGLDDHG